MYLLSLLLALTLPLLSLAQSSQNVQVSTSTILQETLGSNRQTSTITQVTVFTITPSATMTSTNSASGNSSSSGNSTSVGNGTTTSSIVSSNLPTAASTVAGADGGGANGAPSPGASAAGGVYGPPDGYIAGAEALRSASILGAIGLFVGGALALV